MQRIRANFAVGLNCPVSIELIVLRDTPTISARADCESFLSPLASFNLFFKTNLLFIFYITTEMIYAARNARDAVAPNIADIR